jgi:hypothetical protein
MQSHRRPTHPAARARGPKIEAMRRESSTVVVLVGDVSEGLLAGLAQSPNVSVARAPAAPAPAAAARPAGTARTAGTAGAARTGGTARTGGNGERRADARAAGSAAVRQRPGWETAAMALREAARRNSTYVIVPDDPLADVAASWRAMWDLQAGLAGAAGAAGFEEHAAETLAAWRAKRFELPDYYLVVAPSQGAVGTGPDLYLGPLRAVRPRRVTVAAAADGAAEPPRLLDTLRSLQHGPWWPPLDDLLDAARRFYAGGLAETQQALA